MFWVKNDVIEPNVSLASSKALEEIEPIASFASFKVEGEAGDGAITYLASSKVEGGIGFKDEIGLGASSSLTRSEEEIGLSPFSASAKTEGDESEDISSLFWEIKDESEPKRTPWKSTIVTQSY